MPWILESSLALIAFVLVPRVALAGEGALDRTFAGRGAVLTDFAGNDDYGYSVAVQADGKVLAVGQSGVYPLFHSALLRFESNGRLDLSFGIAGKVVQSLDPLGDQLTAVALQPDGRIVAAGAVIGSNAQKGFLVARFLSDGSLDPSFGSGGVTTTSFGDPTAAAAAIVLQPDGKIVLAGVSGAGPYSELNDFALARYDANGLLDPTFGGDGRVITHFPGVTNTGSRAASAVLQPDGMLLVAGVYKNEGTPREFASARYRSDGSLDPSFGIGGKVTLTPGFADALAQGAALRLDGRILLAGSFEKGHHDHEFALASLDAHGALDASFGNGGWVLSDLFAGSDDIAYGVALQLDGKAIAFGRTGQYPNFAVGLARYTTSGELDPTFGELGRTQTTFGGFSSQAFGGALQQDGKLVVGGYSSNASTNIVVARYLAHPLTH
jgi:uncharacterized delta-60 repeat protein